MLEVRTGSRTGTRGVDLDLASLAESSIRPIFCASSDRDLPFMNVKIPFECPGCHHQGGVPVKYLGGIVTCRRCECQLRLPGHFRLPCPHCEETIRVGAHHLAQDVACKFCHQRFQVTTDRALPLTQLTVLAPSESISLGKPTVPAPEVESTESPWDSSSGILPILEPVSEPPEPLPDDPPHLSADQPEPEITRRLADLEARDREHSEARQELRALHERLETETRRVQSLADAARQEADDLRRQLDETALRHQEERDARLDEQRQQFEHEQQTREAALGERLSALEAERDRLRAAESEWHHERQQLSAQRLEAEHACDVLRGATRIARERA